MNVPALAARDWPGGVDLKSSPLTADTLAAADCAVIVTDHKAFDYKLIVDRSKVVVDSRNAIKHGAPNVFKLGAPAKT